MNLAWLDTHSVDRRRHLLYILGHCENLFKNIHSHALSASNSVFQRNVRKISSVPTHGILIDSAGLHLLRFGL